MQLYRMGKVISVTGSLADTLGVKNPLRYRGYYYDVETKLYYLQSRYYDTETCRFINADSLLVAGDDYIQGVNMFAYCQNNPVMYSDPSGKVYDPISNSFREPQEEVGAAVAALIIVGGLIEYITEYALGIGMSENDIKVSLVDFLNRTIGKDDDIFDLASMLLLGVNVMTKGYLPTIIYSNASMLSDLIDVMKFSFQVDFGIMGIAQFATSVFIDMLEEFYNPLNDNEYLKLVLFKHVVSEVGGIAITASGAAIASALVATNPVLAAVAGTAWIWVGSKAWGDIMKN